MNTERPPSLLDEEAVALTYNPDDTAPKIVAKGRGLIARAIIEKAHESGVYVHESPELVSLLMQVDLDERIPPALYTVVAELLAWLWRVEAGEDAAPPTISPLEPFQDPPCLST